MHAIEIEWIKLIQNKLRFPLLDGFFIFCDYLDTVWFLILLIGGIFYLFNRKAALSLLFILILSGIFNFLLKDFFQMPRPCHIAPVGLLSHKSYGFPSGAAQTAAIIAGFTLFKSSHTSLKMSAIVFALILCFSRIYLGVHFFSDIIGGIVVGSFLLLTSLRSFPTLENQWVKFSIALSIIFLAFGKGRMFPQAAMMIGFSIGIFLSKKVTLFSLWRWRIVAFVLAILGAVSFAYLGEIYRGIQPITSFIAALWFLWIPNVLISKIALYLENY